MSYKGLKLKNMIVGRSYQVTVENGDGVIDTQTWDGTFRGGDGHVITLEGTGAQEVKYLLEPTVVEDLTLFYTLENELEMTYGVDQPSDGLWYNAGGVFEAAAAKNGTKGFRAQGSYNTRLLQRRCNGIIPFNSARIGFWHRPVVPGNIQQMMFRFQSDDGADMQLYYNINGTYYVRYKTPGTATFTTDTTPTGVTTNTWNFIEFSYDTPTNTVAIYINGNLEVTKSDETMMPFTVYNDDGTDQFQWGAVSGVAGYTHHFDHLLISNDADRDLTEFQDATASPNYPQGEDWSDLKVFWRGESRLYNPILETYATQPSANDDYYLHMDPGCTIQPTSAKVGSNGLQVVRSATYTTADFEGENVAPPDSGRMGFWMRIQSFDSSSDRTMVPVWVYPSNAAYHQLKIDSGKVYLRWRDTGVNDGTTELAHSWVLNTWNFIELVWDIGTQLFEMRMDGSNFMTYSATSMVTQDTGWVAKSVRIGNYADGINYHLDFDNVMVSTDYTRNLYDIRNYTESPKL